VLFIHKKTDLFINFYLLQKSYKISQLPFLMLDILSLYKIIVSLIFLELHGFKKRLALSMYFLSAWYYAALAALTLVREGVQAHADWVKVNKTVTSFLIGLETNFFNRIFFIFNLIYIQLNKVVSIYI
jgi:hypothetical protein